MESKKTPPFSKNVLGKPLGISSSQSTTKKPPASKIQPNLPKSTIKKVPRGSTASNGSTSSDSSNIDPSVKEEKRASLILLQSEFMRVKAQNELDDTKNHMEQEVFQMSQALMQEKQRLSCIQQEIKTIDFLTQYASKAELDIQKLEQLKKELPGIVEKLEKIATFLENNQNHLGISGLKAQTGEISASDLKKILTEHDRQLESCASWMKDFNEEMKMTSETLSKADLTLRKGSKVHSQFASLSTLLQQRLVMKKSRELGLKNSSLTLDPIIKLPPEVEEPRLLDI